jgi:hypothetical protein
MPGTEVFYTEDGARRDAVLHDPILAAGDDAAAREVSKRVLRRNGWTDAQIRTLFGE